MTHNSLEEKQKQEISFFPGKMDKPCFLMCPPFAHDAKVANNVWMTEYAPEDLKIDPKKSLVQFLNLYNFIASESLVYLLPAPPNSGLQDQVFTANLAFVPEHVQNKNIAIISNFTSEPRRGETHFGKMFFENMGYQTVVAPYRFEGDAEIKHLYDNVYIGGYGERTDRQVYDWMESEFDMRIIKVEEKNPYFYHLDCSVFPISSEETIICPEVFSDEEVKAISKVTDIIKVSEDDLYNGICNSIRLHNLVLNASYIHELSPGTDDYKLELAKNRTLVDICAERGMEVVFFNLSEYFKSGALLSCMVMSLNRHSFETRLI